MLIGEETGGWRGWGSEGGREKERRKQGWGREGWRHCEACCRAQGGEKPRLRRADASKANYYRGQSGFTQHLHGENLRLYSFFVLLLFPCGLNQLVSTKTLWLLNLVLTRMDFEFYFLFFYLFNFFKFLFDQLDCWALYCFQCSFKPYLFSKCVYMCDDWQKVS